MLFSTYRGYGYEGLQLKAGQYLSCLDDPGQAQPVFADDAAFADDAGLCSGLIFGGQLDDTGLSALRRVIDFAALVKSERVVFCHNHPRAEVTADDLRRFASVLSSAGSYAHDRGTTLSLHHHYNQPVMFPDDIRLFFEYTQPGSVGLTIDTAHMWMAGVDDVGATIEEFADVLDNVHLKDCRDDAPGQRLPSGARTATAFVPLGQGQLDFEPVFRALRSTGYSGWLCVDEESGADIGQSLKLSYDFVSERLSRPVPPATEPIGTGRYLG